MTNVSGSTRGEPWQDERMLPTTHIRGTAAGGTNWAAWRRRQRLRATAHVDEWCASTVRPLRPLQPRAPPAASQVPSTRPAGARRADGAGRKRTAVMVSRLALRATTWHRVRRFTSRRQPQLKKKSETLNQRVRRLRARNIFLQRSRLRPTMPTKFFLALEKILGKWILQELPTWTSARWEATLQDHVTLLLEESQERSVPAWPAAAVHWLAPNVGRPKMAVSLVIAAFLRGWMTQRPSIARPPPSYTIMMLINFGWARTGEQATTR